MKADRLFLVVQRINSLLLFVFGVFALVWILALTWEEAGRHLSRRDAPASVRVRNDAGRQRQLAVNSFERIPGTDVVWSPLRSGDGDAKLFSGSYSPVRNYLFFNLGTGDAKVLLQSKDPLIPWRQVVEEPGTDCSDRVTVALLFHLITKDTDGDGELTEHDTGAIAVSLPDGSALTELSDGVESVFDFHTGKNSRGFVFYLRGGAIWVTELSLTDRRVVGTRSLSPVLPVGTTVQ